VGLRDNCEQVSPPCPVGHPSPEFTRGKDFSYAKSEGEVIEPQVAISKIWTTFNIVNNSSVIADDSGRIAAGN
jgi:hypothetical protein